jgi:hypothetical protein
VKTAVHTISAAKYETCLEKQLDNFRTSNSSMLMKYHTDDSAEWERII